MPTVLVQHLLFFRTSQNCNTVKKCKAFLTSYVLPLQVQGLRGMYLCPNDDHTDFWIEQGLTSC